MNSIHAKIDKMQPMQELAFHKEQCEINGVQFVPISRYSIATNPTTRENSSTALI